MQVLTQFTGAEIRQIGFYVLPKVVRAFIPEDAIGVYALFAESKTISA